MDFIWIGDPSFLENAISGPTGGWVSEFPTPHPVAGPPLTK